MLRNVKCCRLLPGRIPTWLLHLKGLKEHDIDGMVKAEKLRGKDVSLEKLRGNGTSATTPSLSRLSLCVYRSRGTVF